MSYLTTPDAPIVAIANHPLALDMRYDECWTWEAGQTYAAAGYVVTALSDDGFMAREDMQSLFDHERELFIDCWGRTTPFDN